MVLTDATDTISVDGFSVYATFAIRLNRSWSLIDTTDSNTGVAEAAYPDTISDIEAEDPALVADVRNAHNPIVLCALAAHSNAAAKALSLYAHTTHCLAAH